jgi:hypothetical protein
MITKLHDNRSKKSKIHDIQHINNCWSEVKASKLLGLRQCS